MLNFARDKTSEHKASAAESKQTYIKSNMIRFLHFSMHIYFAHSFGLTFDLRPLPFQLKSHHGH